MTKNTNAPGGTGANADEAARIHRTVGLSAKASAWLAGKAASAEILAQLNASHVAPHYWSTTVPTNDPEVVWIDWQDNVFKDRVGYIHPDARWRLARKCSRHKADETAPAKDTCPGHGRKVGNLSTPGDGKDVCDIRKSLMPWAYDGRKHNGLSLSSCWITGGKKFLVVEGIGQHIAVASSRMGGRYEDWAVVGMNGCHGIHEGTDLSWARDADIMLVFDADRHTNPRVAEAVKRVTNLLYKAGANGVWVWDL